jgi:hypothetical protein
MTETPLLSSGDNDEQPTYQIGDGKTHIVFASPPEGDPAAEIRAAMHRMIANTMDEMIAQAFIRSNRS